MKKDKNKDIEEKLLNQSSLDDLIKRKMEEEMAEELANASKKPEKKVIKDISKVPTELIFSSRAVYKIFNRVNKTETYLNGMQAEAMIGLQNSVREKFKSGQMDAFSTENAYVKFEYIEC